MRGEIEGRWPEGCCRGEEEEETGGKPGGREYGKWGIYEIGRFHNICTSLILYLIRRKPH